MIIQILACVILAAVSDSSPVWTYSDTPDIDPRVFYRSSVQNPTYDEDYYMKDDGYSKMKPADREGIDMFNRIGFAKHILQGIFPSLNVDMETIGRILPYFEEKMHSGYEKIRDRLRDVLPVGFDEHMINNESPQFVNPTDDYPEETNPKPSNEMGEEGKKFWNVMYQQIFPAMVNVYNEIHNPDGGSPLPNDDQPEEPKNDYPISTALDRLIFGRGRETNEEQPGRRSMTFLTGLASVFLRPIFGDTGSSVNLSLEMKRKAELAALRKLQLDLRAELTFKKKFEKEYATTLSEKTKAEAEINRLKMQLDLLKAQKDSEYQEKAKEMSAKISEDKFKALQEELHTKLKADYEHEVKKLQQERTEMLNSYQQHLINRNKHIVDHTVIQPTVEYRPTIIKGSYELGASFKKHPAAISGHIDNQFSAGLTMSHPQNQQYSSSYEYQNSASEAKQEISTNAMTSASQKAQPFSSYEFNYGFY